MAANHDVCVAHCVVDFLSDRSWHHVPILVGCTLCRPLKHTTPLLVSRADAHTHLAHLRVARPLHVASTTLSLVQPASNLLPRVIISHHVSHGTVQTGATLAGCRLHPLDLIHLISMVNSNLALRLGIRVVTTGPH